METTPIQMALSILDVYIEDTLQVSQITHLIIWRGFFFLILWDSLHYFVYGNVIFSHTRHFEDVFILLYYSNPVNVFN